VAPGEAADASFRLERSTWRGTVEPRLVLRHAQPCRPRPIRVVGEPESYFAGVLAELDAPLAGPEPFADDVVRVAGERRTVVDRRGGSPAAVLADATATGESVIAICAEAGRRLAGLSARTGGFTLATHHAVEREPWILSEFVHVVVLDPSSCRSAERLLMGGEGFAHLSWGPAELRFAQQMHELEYGLRASLVALYRGLMRRERATGQELEHLLRGDGPHGRPARLAGRLVRVLAELELVSLDRDPPALAIAGGEQTELRCSPAYRAYEARYEDGQRFLSSANPGTTG
jgi:single-stranded-DNA-specific exonuclease